MLSPRRLGFVFLATGAAILPAASLDGPVGGAAIGGGLFCVGFGLLLVALGWPGREESSDGRNRSPE